MFEPEDDEDLWRMEVETKIAKDTGTDRYEVYKKEQLKNEGKDGVYKSMHAFSVPWHKIDEKLIYFLRQTGTPPQRADAKTLKADGDAASKDIELDTQGVMNNVPKDVCVVAGWLFRSLMDLKVAPIMIHYSLNDLEVQMPVEQLWFTAKRARNSIISMYLSAKYYSAIYGLSFNQKRFNKTVARPSQ